MNGQTQPGTSISYIHNKPASFKSQLLQSLMRIVGKKNQLEKKISAQNFTSEAAGLPRYLSDNLNVQVNEINNRSVWTLEPVQNAAQNVIFYIHGGAYVSNITKYDWKLIQELLIKTKSTIVVPDYPLAPDSNCNDVYNFFDTLYNSLLSKVPQQRIIVFGNSAGGGFALSFAQKLRNENRLQPSQIILISPWLDITMSNEDLLKVDKKDRFSGINGLQMAGKAYAGPTDKKDYKVSPIYGEFTGLGQISLFIGTNDLFIADARKLKNTLNKKNIHLNYFEYPKMFHVWVAVTNLKESKHAIE